MEKQFKIFRFDPEVDKEPRYQTYTVLVEPRLRILDCLNKIKWEQDGTLGYRMSCAHGVCGSDGMRINGVCSLACQKLVQDYETSEILIEPLPHYKILKDLIVDVDSFLSGIKYFHPYLMNSSPAPEKERNQSPEEILKVQEQIRCILCACCTGACPVLDEGDPNHSPNYVGPAALVWAYRYTFDSRDDHFIERLKRADFPDGVWACVNYFECTRVCPKGIPVTKSINLLKREIKKNLENK
jgi:succinate dehydrogenase / fumarate reductase iron-sulfur subunit